MKEIENSFTRRRHRRRPILDLPSHILERIRLDGPLSRVELARRIGVGPATSGSHVERMIEADLLQECADSSEAYTGRGRPPTLVSLNPSGGAMVGLDLEGPVLRAVRFDFCLNVESERVVDLPAEVSSANLRRNVNRAVEAVKPAPDVNWIGIGVSAPTSLLRPKVTNTAKSLREVRLFPGINVDDLLGGLRERFNCRVVVENDMCCIASGERLVGVGQNCEYFISVASRAGWTGAAILANGELTAAPQRGLDIGSWLLPIREDFHPDLPSIQGRDGQPRFSLNTICSAEGLLKFYREARRIHGEAEDLPESFGFAELCECFQEGEASAIDAVEVAARALGRVVARADDILNFDRIILDGLFQEMGDDFTRRVSRHFREFSMRYEEAREENGKIIFSQLGDRAAAIGAAGQLLSYYESASSVKTESASSPA